MSSKVRHLRAFHIFAKSFSYKYKHLYFLEIWKYLMSSTCIWQQIHQEEKSTFENLWNSQIYKTKVPAEIELGTCRTPRQCATLWADTHTTTFGNINSCEIHCELTLPCCDVLLYKKKNNNKSYRITRILNERWYNLISLTLYW